MATRRTRTISSITRKPRGSSPLRISGKAALPLKAAELALAAPQVVAHRLTRLALAGNGPLSARDRKEFSGMVHEKHLAFGQAWVAMAAEAMRANEALMLQMARWAWTPWVWGQPAHGRRLTQRGAEAALGVFGKGMAPIHKKAVANARRLAFTPLR